MLDTSVGHLMIESSISSTSSRRKCKVDGKISTSTQSSPAFGHEGLLQATEWGTSIEFSAGGGLLPANPASDDICHKVVFSTHMCSGYAAQHGNLTHMGQGVGDRTLEQL